jgi:hypothetical protein
MFERAQGGETINNDDEFSFNYQVAIKNVDHFGLICIM